MLRLQNNLEYIKIQGLFLCVEKNSFIQAWYLLTKTRPFNLHLPANNRFLKIIPGKFIKIFRILRIILQYLILKYTKHGIEDGVISVPYDGHLLLKTSNGFKLFNLKENVVATQYDINIKKDLFSCVIKNIKYIEGLNISPKIRSVDNVNKCLYEQYINSYKAGQFYPTSLYFYKVILPVWQNIIEVYPSRKINLFEYVTNQKSYILNIIEKLKKESYDNKLLISISIFIESLTNKILNEHNQTNISISLSHGDLHPWNILISRKTAVVIDWDTLKERSLYHDLFYMFFQNIFGKEDVNLEGFIFHLNRSINITSYKFKNKDINNKLSKISINKDLYRLLFYLEYVQLDFEKRLNMFTDRSHILDRIVKINECIKAFEQVEMKINE
ncbi:phosphotransferase [Virgibacillus oceani]